MCRLTIPLTNKLTYIEFLYTLPVKNKEIYHIVQLHSYLDESHLI